MEEHNTTFKQTLKRDLRIVADADALNEFQLAYPFLDAREEMIEAVLGYYTPELLQYEPFQREFTPVELTELQAFLNRLAGIDTTKWELFSKESHNLLQRLT